MMYVLLAVLKRVVPLQTLARWAWVEADRRPDLQSFRRVTGAIQGVRRRLRASDDCLQASLLLYRELSRLGAEPILAVGFRRAGEQIEGHAWVSVDGEPVPDTDRSDAFIPVFHFGRHGALVKGQRV